MKRIIIACGQDSSGKSMLLDFLGKNLKHNYLHATYSKDKEFNCLKHHENYKNLALEEVKWQTILIDRLSPSEYAYSKAFRNGESYDTISFMKNFFNECKEKNIKIDLIYCKPSVDTFKTQDRVEMFDDMTKVKKYYDEWFSKFKDYYLFDWVKDKDYKKLMKDLNIERDV